MRDLRKQLKSMKRKIVRDTRRAELELEEARKEEYHQQLREGAEPEMIRAMLPHEKVVNDEKPMAPEARPVKKSVRRYH